MLQLLLPLQGNGEPSGGNLQAKLASTSFGTDHTIQLEHVNKSAMSKKGCLLRWYQFFARIVFRPMSVSDWSLDVWSVTKIEPHKLTVES